MTTDVMLGDGTWLPHRYDKSADSFRFLSLPRTVQRDATFLADEQLAGLRDTVAVPVTAIDQSALPTGPLHLVFQPNAARHFWRGCSMRPGTRWSGDR